jgi:hypothetical protein
MNMYRMGSLIGLSLLGLATFAGAHLKADSLVPAGGGTVRVGDVISIEWNVATDHEGGSEVGLSKDGGTTWTKLTTFADAEGVNKYNWTVMAGDVSATAKLRVCQSSGAVCNNTHNVSAPGGVLVGSNRTAPYVLVGQPFVVATATGITSPSNDSKAMSMDFNPGSRSVEIGFALTAAQTVVLQAFDTQGRLVATLLEGNYGTGAHKMSVFSNRLETLAGAGVLKLKVGEEVKMQTWNAVK